MLPRPFEIAAPSLATGLDEFDEVAFLAAAVALPAAAPPAFVALPAAAPPAFVALPALVAFPAASTDPADAAVTNTTPIAIAKGKLRSYFVFCIEDLAYAVPLIL